MVAVADEGTGCSSCGVRGSGGPVRGPVGLPLCGRAAAVRPTGMAPDIEFETSDSSRPAPAIWKEGETKVNEVPLAMVVLVLLLTSPPLMSAEAVVVPGSGATPLGGLRPADGAPGSDVADVAVPVAVAGAVLGSAVKCDTTSV